MRRVWFALLLASSALALLPPAAAAAREFDIEVGTRPDGSMYVDPSNITVNIGDNVLFRVKNVDSIFHDIAILDYDGEDVEIEVPRGRTETHTLKATVAGDFRMICEVSGHKQKGMVGFLHVVDPSAKRGLSDAGALGALLALAGAFVLVARER